MFDLVKGCSPVSSWTCSQSECFEVPEIPDCGRIFIRCNLCFHSSIHMHYLHCARPGCTFKVKESALFPVSRWMSATTSIYTESCSTSQDPHGNPCAYKELLKGGSGQWCCHALIMLQGEAQHQVLFQPTL